jgi:hypothetical protein
MLGILPDHAFVIYTNALFFLCFFFAIVHDRLWYKTHYTLIDKQMEVLHCQLTIKTKTLKSKEYIWRRVIYVKYII